MFSNRGGGAKKCRALYDYQGQAPSDLSFKKGDVINIISEQSNSGPEWWYGELRGTKGDFPHNHVEAMNDVAVQPAYSAPASTPAYNPVSYNPTPVASYSPTSAYTPTNAYSPSNNSYSPSNAYTPSFSPTVDTTPAPTKAPKQSSSSISGGEGGRYFNIMFGINVALLVCASLSLVLPWYCNFVNQKFSVRVWQWMGASEFSNGAVTPFFAPPSLKAGYRSYNSLAYPTVSGVLLVTFIFMLAASALSVVLVIWSHMYRTSQYPGTKKKFVIVSGLTAIFAVIGFCQFFRFTTAYALDVEPGCVAQICASFSGSETPNYWGPTFGWMLGLFAMVLSLASFGMIFKAAKEDSELPTIPFLNR